MWIVIDTRNGNKMGPFSQVDARQLAVDLNDFVLRNAGIKSRPFLWRRGLKHEVAMMMAR
jgi:hypothetical protein